MSRFFRRIKKEVNTSLFSVLPRETRDNFIRSKLRLDVEAPKDIKFKLAETKEELEQVFKLLYHSYVRSGSMKPHESEMRITPYHALPNTSILIAVLNGKVIATLSVFRMSSFGIPVSKVFDVSQMTKEGTRFAEISSLTLDEKYRNDNREIIFGLLKYLHIYVTKYFGIDMKLIVIKPFRRFFYESLLLFEPIENRLITNYKFSNGATVMGEKLDLRTAKERYRKTYDHLPDEQNLYKFFFDERVLANCEFPERNYNVISDPVMSPELLSYFFCEKTDILNNMSEFERSVLKSLYPQSKYKFVFNKTADDDISKRDEVRIDCECPARIVSLSKNSQLSMLGADIQIRNISYNGLLGFTSAKLNESETYRAQIEIGPQKICTLELKACWHSGFGHYGFQIVKSEDLWEKFVSESTLLLEGKKVG